MRMETLNLVQGSEEWKNIRGLYCVASEAPVVMGDSPHTSRDELLFLKATGEEKEINAWVEKFVFKKGHDVEEKARPIAEARMGESLYPVTGIRTVDGVKLLASFDGLTMFEDNHWEHKQYNKELYSLVNSSGELEGQHYWQLEHQMLVAGTESCVFACSDGTEDNYVELVYHSRPERRAQLIEGWKLFLQDKENFELKTPKAEVVGKSPMDLPALRIDIEGRVLATNLDRYKQVALDVFANINTDLKTDDDFANAEKTVKWCNSVEEKLEAAKQHALGQTASIDELFRTIDDLREECRSVRLNLKKRVDDRKKEVKWEIAQAAKKEFEQHVATLNKALGGSYMPAIPTDFNTAMKGKRTVATLESAANDELARARIEANRMASRIEENLELIAKEAEGFEMLFADKKTLIVEQSKEALAAIVKQRIAAHQEAEEKARAAREALLAQTASVEGEKQETAETAQPVEPEAAELPFEAEQKPQQDIPRTVQKSIRPNDADIIAAVAERFDVPDTTALQWIMEINIRSESQRLVSNA